MAHMMAHMMVDPSRCGGSFEVLGLILNVVTDKSLIGPMDVWWLIGGVMARWSMVAHRRYGGSSQGLWLIASV